MTRDTRNVLSNAKVSAETIQAASRAQRSIAAQWPVAAEWPVAAGLQVEQSTWENFEAFPDLYKRLRLATSKRCANTPSNVKSGLPISTNKRP